jgi:hypothetical protein
VAKDCSTDQAVCAPVHRHDESKNHSSTIVPDIFGRLSLSRCCQTFWLIMWPGGAKSLTNNAITGKKDNHHALDVGTELPYFLQIWRRQVFPYLCLQCRLSKIEANCKASVLLLQVSH